MITKEHIPLEVRIVAETLEKAGFEAYLVGGCVRDILTGKTPKDWDITTNAHPEDVEKIFESTFMNNDFGTVGVVNEETEDESLKVVEVTPYRSESGYSDARRPDEVTFGVSLDDDLTRRDFTVNAIAYRVKDNTLVDPFDGQKDVKDKKLRAVGEARLRFEEDALRMMRAVRLAVEHDFIIEAETMAAITQNASNLERISKERIRDEFVRIINSAQPMQGIVFLEKLGLLPYVLPHIADGIGIEQNQAHAYDVYEHNLRSLQHAADKNYPFEIRLAALLHDIGKPATREHSEEKRDWTFYNHEVVGAKMAKNILKDLKFPRETTETVTKLVRWHMFFSDPDQVTLSAVRRTIRNVGEEQIWNLLNLRICDRIGTGRPKEQPFRFRKYKSMVEEALRDPISVKMLKMDGGKIMGITGEKPGPKLGNILHALLEEVLDDPKKNTEEYLEKRVKELSGMPEKELRALGEKGKEKQAETEAQEIKKIRRKNKVY
ncbi:HD domain-containing protein [Candidatus Kaiserbacteria bacterium]|nr:HD domain-containing protein [Candidatus Kaiserbacteria bacterium]